jgi:glycosyltransferase involved in cell wall biosynthesis
MRVLILDFDFFSAVGGGQTFYRRVVARHPEVEFFYPSRGPDLKGPVRRTLPGNVTPFAFDQFVDVSGLLPPFAGKWPQSVYGATLCRIARVWRGAGFDIVEIPSFFPVAHLVRPVFAAHGIAVGRISLGLLGWLSVSNRNAYRNEGVEGSLPALEEIEQRCLGGADIRYAISERQVAEGRAEDLPVARVDMQDALEAFPDPAAELPGEGPPDLWYVGRLDRNKGPDLFLEMAARLPRSLYRHCCLTGPDNPWMDGERWSHRIESLSASLGIAARYVGQLSDEEIRNRIYRGRCVVVVPSRSDAFNYVAVEALANGCPILLSKHAGVAGFLAERYPAVLPPIVDPENLDASAAALRDLLTNYAQAALALREKLRRSPWPRPRHGFMTDIWSGPALRSAQNDRELSELHAGILACHPLENPATRDGRSREDAASRPILSCVVWAPRADAGLSRTLASLSRLNDRTAELMIVDDGSNPSRPLHDSVRAILPGARLLRQGAQGRAAAWNRGLAGTHAPYLCFLESGEGGEASLLDSMLATLQREEPGAVAITVPMTDYRIDGRPVPATEGSSEAGRIVLLSRRALDRAGGFDTTLDRLSRQELCLRLARIGRVLEHRDGQAWRWVADSEDRLPVPPGERARMEAKSEILERWRESDPAPTAARVP